MAPTIAHPPAACTAAVDRPRQLVDGRLGAHFFLGGGDVEITVAERSAVFEGSFQVLFGQGF